ncbi:TlyA family rRNA (cytidine-2'-O)-methyltransferase, partial [Enterococcus faecium]|nr:TlyA family rRNA (cytidine-2'-O)-methyltransferase [Enterococcus faecium]
LKNIIKTHGSVVSLIKPQFEAGRENVGKHGIVRDRKVHEEVLKNVLAMANAEGFNVKGLDFSPIKGGEGNIEFLAWLERSDTDQGVIEENVDTQKVIDSAYSNLNS